MQELFLVEAKQVRRGGDPHGPFAVLGDAEDGPVERVESRGGNVDACTIEERQALSRADP